MSEYVVFMRCRPWPGHPDEARTRVVAQQISNSLPPIAGLQVRNVEAHQRPTGFGTVDPTAMVTYKVVGRPPHEAHHQQLVHSLDSILRMLGHDAVDAVVSEVIDYTLQSTLGGGTAGGIGSLFTANNGHENKPDFMDLLLRGFTGVVVGAGLSALAAQFFKGTRPVCSGQKNVDGTWRFSLPEK